MSIVLIKDVKPGMILEKNILQPDSEFMLLKAGTILSNRNVEKLRELGIAWIDVADRNTVLLTPTDKMEESLVEDFIHVLRNISPERPEANKNDQVVVIAKELENHIKEIAKNEDILNIMVELRIIDKVRLYDHSIYTAVLSGLVAGSMGIKRDGLVNIVIGALLHNIGVAEMPSLIKTTTYTEQQRKLWEEHPTYGYYFAQQKNISKDVANMIYAHHERFDGSGYPRGLRGADIHLGARIIGVCADYAAGLIYLNKAPYMAVEELYGTSGIYYDPKVVNAFVKTIPIYPLGVMVRLSTKEVGIVSNIRNNEGPRPLVKIYYNRVNRPITEDKIIDLGKERTIFIEEIL